MKNNKVTTYLLYAVGEIILVVVGILIAVQLDNWNEAEQKSSLEKKMLMELLSNLRKDSIDNEVNMNWYKEAEVGSKVINEALENQIPWNDSLAIHFGSLYRHGIATFNTSTYETLKSIGLDLIRNDSIRIELTTLYTLNYELLQKSEEEFAKDSQIQLILPILSSRVKMKSWYEAIPYDYEALMDDIIFQETVRVKGHAMWYIHGNTRAAQKRVVRLITMIENELNKE